MRKCEKCGKWFDETLLGKYSSGRFCSRSCANTRNISEATKRKISKSVRKNYASRNKPTKKELLRIYAYQAADDSLNIDMPIRTCVVCGKRFYHFKPVKTCSKTCCKKLHDELNDKQRNKQKIKYKNDGNWADTAYETLYKYYFTYKTVNIVNGKYYYGIHMTNNLNDGYLGSGKRLLQAIKKYGRDNFKRIILNYYNCYKDLAEAEVKLVTKTVLADKQCYNLTTGGIGGPAFKGHKHSEKTKQKLRDIAKTRPQMSEETKRKISESQKGRVAWNKGLKLK